MAAYSQLEMDKLIACPKKILNPPAKSLRASGGHLRNDCKLVASDETKGTFSVFLRVNEDFPENFSIGLIFSANDARGELILLRFNGKHGAYNNGANPDHWHYDYHIHKASEEALDAGFAVEKKAEKTTAFGSYEQAVQHFIRVINLNSRDAAKHFPPRTQFDLFSNQ